MRRPSSASSVRAQPALQGWSAHSRRGARDSEFAFERRYTEWVDFRHALVKPIERASVPSEDRRTELFPCSRVFSLMEISKKVKIGLDENWILASLARRSSSDFTFEGRLSERVRCIAHLVSLSRRHGTAADGVRSGAINFSGPLPPPRRGKEQFRPFPRLDRDRGLMRTRSVCGQHRAVCGHRLRARLGGVRWAARWRCSMSGRPFAMVRVWRG